MANKSKKGSAFEREISKKLSLWWTNNERDDVFWRTSGSGARATTRKKQGLITKNSNGDISALDPIGEPLIDKFYFELKKGYPEAADILKIFYLKRPSTLSLWWEKMLKEKSDNQSPVLIYHPFSKKTLIIVEEIIYHHLRENLSLIPKIQIVDKNGNRLKIMLFDDFLDKITPKLIIQKF